MAQYRLLADLWLPLAGGTLVPAGAIVSDVPPSGQLPPGFVPSAYMDALDADAASKVYAAGPQFAQIGTTLVQPAKTYWVVDPNASPGNPDHQFVLVGLGAGQMAQLLGKRLG
jgi:hypothetical protein